MKKAKRCLAVVVLSAALLAGLGAAPALATSSLANYTRTQAYLTNRASHTRCSWETRVVTFTGVLTNKFGRAISGGKVWLTRNGTVIGRYYTNSKGVVVAKVSVERYGDGEWALVFAGSTKYFGASSKTIYAGPKYRFDYTASNANMLESVYLRSGPSYQFVVDGSGAITLDLGSTLKYHWAHSHGRAVVTALKSQSFMFYAENDDWSNNGIRVRVW